MTIIDMYTSKSTPLSIPKNLEISLLVSGMTATTITANHMTDHNNNSAFDTFLSLNLKRTLLNTKSANIIINTLIHSILFD